jgi:hypothetical protein
MALGLLAGSGWKGSPCCMGYNSTMSFEPVRKRYGHIKSIASWWWAVMFGLWTLFQTTDWIVEKWGSATGKAQWEARTSHVVPFGWQIWLIGILFISVLMFFEGSYRYASKLNCAHRTEVEKLISATCPQLVFQRWGQIPKDHPEATPITNVRPLGSLFVQNGFYLANDGDAAHDIKVESFEIIPSVRVMTNSVSRIEAKGQGFALAWMEVSAQHSVEDAIGAWISTEKTRRWMLSAAMRINSDERRNSQDWETELAVIYRDANMMWYRSKAPMKYIRSQNRIVFGSTTHTKLGVEQEVPQSVQMK